MDGKFSVNFPDLTGACGSSVRVSSSTTRSSSSTRSPSPRSNSPSITEAAMRATGLVPSVSSSGRRRSPSPCENCDRHSNASGATAEASAMEEGRRRSTSPVGDIFSKINAILDKDNKLGFGDFLGSSAVGRDRDPDERKQQPPNQYQYQQQQLDANYGGINGHYQGGPPQFARGAGVESALGSGYGFTNPQFQALNNVLGVDSLARNTQQAWFGNNIVPGVDGSINSDNCYNPGAANFKHYNRCEKFVTSPAINNCPTSSSGLRQQQRHPNETLSGYYGHHGEYCGPSNLGSAGSSGINSPDDDVAAAYNRFGNVARGFSPAELRPANSASPTLDEALVMGPSNEGRKKQHVSGSSNATDSGSTGSRPGGSTGPRSISPESDAGYGTSYGSGLSKKDSSNPTGGTNSSNRFPNSHLVEQRDFNNGSNNNNNHTGRASVEELAEVFKCLNVTSGPLNGGSSALPSNNFSNLTLAERVALLGNNQAINPNSNLLPGMNEMDPAVAKAVRNQQALQQLGNAVQPNHLQQPGTGINNIVNPLLLNNADSNNNRNVFSPTQNDLQTSPTSEVDGPNAFLHNSVHSSSSTLVDYPSLETAAKIHRQGTALYDASCTWSGVLPPRDMRNAVLSCKVFLGGVPWDITETALLNTFKPFGQIRIEWPGKDSSLVPKGYLYIIFENEKQVKSLLNACTHDFGSGGSWYVKISSRRMRNKEVQVIPWVIADSNHVKMQSQRLDPQKTVFVGALHGMLTAEGLCKIFNELFGGVVYAGVDTDKYKYPIGSGRVTFNNTRSYMKAVSAAFIEIRTGKFNKKVQVDPYLEDALCSSCGLRQGPYFCRDLTCFEYFCRSCWEIQHTNEGRRHHKPLMRNNSSNPNKTIQGFGGNNPIHGSSDEPQSRPPRPASTNSASIHRGMNVFENNHFRPRGNRDSKPAGYSFNAYDIGPVGSPVGGEGGYVRRRTNSSSLCDNDPRSPITANYLSTSTGGFNHYFDGGLRRPY